MITAFELRIINEFRINAREIINSLVEHCNVLTSGLEKSELDNPVYENSKCDLRPIADLWFWLLQLLVIKDHYYNEHIEVMVNDCSDLLFCIFGRDNLSYSKLKYYINEMDKELELFDKDN